MKQTVQIIGGQFRGKKLSFPDMENLRPSPNRVRETLFNWLMHEINGARCLDAFAGSGALGFEAFSRGASPVIMVESAIIAFLNLQKIAHSFNKDGLAVINTDVRQFLQTTSETFDIIFLDPPFASNYLKECVEILATANVLAQGGLIYVESPNQSALDTDVWSLRKSKRAGQVFYALYEKR